MNNLDFGFKASYGLGQLSVGSLTLFTRICLFFFYSQVLGLPPLLAGLASVISSVFDAITDPIIGSLSDNWRSKYGRRFPFLALGTIPTAIFVFLLFTPLVEGDFLLFFWFVTFASLTNLFITFFAIPHYALGAELSEDYLERASIVGFRQFFYFFGQVITLFLAYGYFFAPSEEFSYGQMDPGIYSPFALVVALLYLLASISSIWKTKSIIPTLIQPKEDERFSVIKSFKSIFLDVLEALKNRSFRMIFFGNMFTSIAAGLSWNLELYALTFFWGLTGEITFLLVGLAFYPGAFIGLALAKKFINRFEKDKTLLYGTALWIMFVVIPVLLKILGFFENAEIIQLAAILVIFRILQGIAITPSEIAFGASLADIADEQEVIQHKRQEGVFFASAFFSIKASLGVGAGLSGLALWIIAWPTQVENITSDHLFNLGIIIGPVVGLIGLLACYFYTRYDLTKDRHKEILLELETRQGN
jgi:Na+/melibiose symporter-like transporter